MTMSLIETKTLGSAAASIEFIDIPQDATDLVLMLNARSTRPAVSAEILFRLNGNSGSNYTYRTLWGTGSGRLSTNSTNNTRGYLGIIPATDSTANTFGNGALYIPNYTATTAKSISSEFVSENNDTEAYQFIIANSYSQTTAITSISLFILDGHNFATNTTASLYKITKA